MLFDKWIEACVSIFSVQESGEIYFFVYMTGMNLFYFIIF